MLFRRYLSSLRATYLFMLCFGLLMGIIFPFYSWLFFGRAAFNPLYVVGCLTAGFLVGTFCFFIIRQVLGIYLERQWQTLGRCTGSEGTAITSTNGDELQTLMDRYDTVMESVFNMVSRSSRLITEISPLHHRLMDKSQELVAGNEEQLDKEQSTRYMVEELNDFFGVLKSEIDMMCARTEERASISTEMSATTDSIAGSIRDYAAAVTETSAAIEEMAASIRENAGSVQNLTLSTEQTASSITQISAAIVNVRDNTQRTAECSEKVRRQAAEGMATMAETIAAMMNIDESSTETFEAIRKLSQHTSRVGEVLNIIKGVVDQTNLLSLNASIIAAQAGEHGRAFSVVAEEVRTLARRTSHSASEIDDLIKNIQAESAAAGNAVSRGMEKVAEGVRISGRTDEVLQRIEESAAEASRMVQKIASATMEQADGSRLITEEAEKNLDRVTQINRAIKEQEHGIIQIVASLEQMAMLAQKSTVATQEQARGNKLYLQSVLEDNSLMKKLRTTCDQQIMLGESLLSSVQEAGKVFESNAQEAKLTTDEVETITGLTDQLKQELAAFRSA
jgi:methyl-accepting chemotaxis protein